MRMEVSCSKGTYIRTLCHDIGEKLGCGGCMEELVRTKVSRFTLEDSYTLEEVRQKKEDGTLSEILIPIDAMFATVPIGHFEISIRISCVQWKHVFEKTYRWGNRIDRWRICESL